MIVIIFSRIHFIVVVGKKNNLLLFHVAFDVTIYTSTCIYILFFVMYIQESNIELLSG